jgi:hypothetical protein
MEEPSFFVVSLRFVEIIDLIMESGQLLSTWYNASTLDILPHKIKEESVF